MNSWIDKMAGSHAVRMANRAIRRLEVARKRLRKDLKEQKRIKKKIVSLVERDSLISETMAEDAEDYDKRLAYSEKALDALRSQLQVETEITVPGLQKACKVLEARSEADIAMSNYRRAAATPTPIDRDLQ